MRHAQQGLHLPGELSTQRLVAWDAERPAPPRPLFSRADALTSGRGRSHRKSSRYGKEGASVSGVMATSFPEGVLETQDGTRPQFGNRFLSDPTRVFHHNAWDNVEWSEEQAVAAARKVQENSSQLVCPEKQVDYEINAHKYWNEFYKIHENGFFKDRHWLFTEFPELAPNHGHLTGLPLENQKSEGPKRRSSRDWPGLTTEQHTSPCSSHGVRLRCLPRRRQ